MAFGRKKKLTDSVIVDQGNVAMRATEALAKARSVRVQLLVRLTFTAPVMMNRWEAKSLAQMLGKMTGHQEVRNFKDLTKDYEGSWYRNEKGTLVLPCRVIKAAIIEGAIGTNGIATKAGLKRELRVAGLTTPIHLNGEKTMDVRIVKNQSGPDVRSRAQIPAGSYVDVVLQFPPSLGADAVVAALEAAGNMIGLCEMRPQKGGELGTFEVSMFRSDAKEIAKVLKECSIPEEPLKVPAHMLRALSAIPEQKLTDNQRKVKAVVDHVNGQQATGDA